MKFPEKSSVCAEGFAHGEASPVEATNHPPKPAMLRPWERHSRRAFQVGKGLLSLSLLAIATSTIWAGNLQLGITPMPFGTQYDLTALGTTDWAHWGTGAVFPSYVHKDTGGGLISDVTQIETVSTDSGKASSNPSYLARLCSWTDGTPTASAVDDFSFIYADGAAARQGQGYSITVPADTTLRTLYVLAGGYNTVPKLTASLSDSSALALTNTTSPGSTTNYQRLYAIAFQANSAAQTLTVTYTRQSGSSSVDLVGAWLVVGAPPTVSFAAPTNGATLFKNLVGPSNIELTVNAADLDGSVTNVDYFVDGVLVGSAASRPFSFIWTTATFGSHTLTATATDDVGRTATAQAITVQVNKIITGGGLLQMASKTDVANGTSLDLTALGTSDWAHWGAQGLWGAYDHKATGGGQISDLAEIETVAADSGRATADAANKIRKASWTDGTPTPSAADESGYCYAQASPNGARQGSYGYSFTVPADTQERTLSVLAGGYGATVRVEASLSDPSAADIIDESAPGSTAQWQRIYSIRYKAASAGQSLTVKLLHVAGNFSLDLKEAWLVAGTPPTVSISSPTNNQNILTPLGVPSSITITANATDAESSIAKVDFYVDNAFVGTDTSSPFSCVWTNATLGSHALSAVATDTDHNVTTSASVTVEVNKVVTGGGEISVAYTPVAYGSQFDLSQLGTGDWAHWGLGGVWGAFDRNLAGGSQISDVVKIEPLAGDSGYAYNNIANPAAYASWTNGAPDELITDDCSWIYAKGHFSRQGMGYSFTVPADTSVRTLFVLAGGNGGAGNGANGCVAKLKASLSDPSAADVINMASNVAPTGTTNYFMRVYVVKYHAASAGQTMTVSYTRADGGAELVLKGAWLVAGDASVPQFATPVMSDGNMNLNWTGFGQLQWAPAVDGPWTSFSPVPIPPFSEPVDPGITSRFYRLRLTR